MSDKPTHEQLANRLVEAENKIKEFRILYNAATSIGSNLFLEDAIRSVPMHVANALHSCGCAISRWRRDRNDLEILFDYCRCFPDQADKPGRTYDLRDYPTSLHMLETGRAVLIQVDDPEADKAELEIMREHGIFTNLALPLKTGNRVFGLMEIYENTGKREFTSREIRLAKSLAFQAAVALENAQLYENARNEIAKRIKAEKKLEKLVHDLEKALIEVKTLKGFLPICAACKKIRDDKGYWEEVDSYIESHTDARFSHGMCPDCARKLYPELSIHD